MELNLNELKDMTQLAQQIALQAGELLLDGLTHERTSIETKSSSTDVVTEIDKASEELISKSILSKRPKDAIIGEEDTNHLGTSGFKWIIDPLDGTTNYLYNFSNFSVSIGIYFNESPIIGVVRDPTKKETFWAISNQGAFCNQTKISVNKQNLLQQSLIATGFSYDSQKRTQQAQILTHIIPNIRDIRRAGSAALDLCWVASGRLDGYYESGLKLWDFAAGVLIAQEAGAIVSGLGDKEASSEMIVASNPQIRKNLMDLLLEAENNNSHLKLT